ncbi:hypothetical protein FB451DRAFT_490402, partial [Mycena latifolia]
MDPSESSPPALPPELEQQIFEICALSRPMSIPKLMLVAWRVKEWIEPILYRTIVIGAFEHEESYPIFTASDILLSAIKRKPAAFFHSAVRNLTLYTDYVDDLPTILSACTGVENLWTTDTEGTGLLPLFARLRLKHLHGYVQDFLRTFPPPHPFFSKITHVELFGAVEDTIISSLSLIAQLTHLAFNDSDFITMCPRLLEACPGLSVLVCLDDDLSWLRSVYIPYIADLSKDVRFVAMTCTEFLQDWQTGAYTGIDYWSRAETLIAQRRAGDIDGKFSFSLKSTICDNVTVSFPFRAHRGKPMRQRRRGQHVTPTTIATTSPMYYDP